MYTSIMQISSNVHQIKAWVAKGLNVGKEILSWFRIVVHLI